MPAAMRDANSVSTRLCSSLKAPGWSASTSSTPMTLFLAISGTASSECTPGVELMKFCSVVKSFTRTASRRCTACPVTPCPTLMTNALGNLRRMPNLEAYAQLLRFFVEQQDGEDFVVDDAFQHLGHALQQGVEVQGSIHRIGNFQQVAVDVRRKQRRCIGCYHPGNSVPMIAASCVDIVERRMVGTFQSD